MPVPPVGTITGSTSHSRSRNLTNIGRACLLITAVSALIVLFISDFVELTRNSQYVYALGGNMIDYSAGFVRRGLFGEIIKGLDAICQPFLSVSLLSVLTLLFIMGLIIARMIKLGIQFPFILAILFSPSMFLMHTRVGELMRADMLVLALNLTASCMLLHLITNKGRLSHRLSASFAGMAAVDLLLLILLAAAALIHELSAALLLPVMFLFFIYARRTNRIMHFLAVSDILIVIYIAMMTGFKFQDPGIIAESWSGIYGDPASYRNNSGLLNVADRESAMELAKTSVSQFPYALVKILHHIIIAVAVPFIVLLLSGINFFRSSSSRVRMIRWTMIVLCLAPLGLCITAVDYGRWFSLCAISLTAYTLLLAHHTGRMPRRQSSGIFRKIKNAAAQCTALAAAAVLLNYYLNLAGFLYYNPAQSFIQGRDQIISDISDFPGIMSRLISRDLLLRP